MNAISNLSLTTKLVLTALLVVLFGSLMDSGDPVTQLTSRQSSPVNQGSDYGMTGFTLTIMDEDGHPARVITGKEMTHYEEDDRTEMISPNAHFIKDQQETWVITSQHGQTHGKGELILLTDDVIITRKNNDDIKLRTDKLNINTQKNTAYTDSAVNITSPYGETQSVGLHATLDEKLMNLHSRVKGHYDAPPTE